MKQKTILLRIFIALIMMILVAACGSYMHQPMQPRRAVIGPETPAKKVLLDLPKAKEKIVVAVYKFRDQTGQYKASETGANWSTAVTQGATTILIRALEESGWFIPIERENMANLLNERKIIRTSRAQYEVGDQNNESMLPPLLFAGVILEGGIISYESNILTGGAGIRYFGADASGQYREDRVSIYIRAVSSANGKVLKTVYTTKSILSQEVSIGLFRYVKTKRLLEAETGFTYNEPSEICVTEAIEKAVESLIIEGIQDKLWALQNPKDSASVAINNYMDEKSTNYKSDPLGRILEKNNRGKLSLGVSAGSNSFLGDYTAGVVRPKASIGLGAALSPHWYIDSETGYRGLMVQEKVNDYSMFTNISLRYVFLPYDKFTPFLSFGGGFDYNKSGVGLTNDVFLPQMNGSFGLEYMARKNFGLSVSSGWNYYLNDRFDGTHSGTYNDASWGISVGMKFYFIKLRQKVAYF
ncbi:MAG TPA: CsgG/HfaB family protein [Prolixibacteraceae bacterium]|nr:CsgG/HfaB family protein [Prolixibacteraceae bacterium]